jgi:hypothetical protein
MMHPLRRKSFGPVGPNRGLTGFSLGFAAGHETRPKDGPAYSGCTGSRHRGRSDTPSGDFSCALVRFPCVP